MKPIKVVLYLETVVTSPYQVEWKKLKKKIPFIPYPGLLIKHDEILLSVINCIWDIKKNKIEVYTKKTDLKDSLPPSVVN